MFFESYGIDHVQIIRIMINTPGLATLEEFRSLLLHAHLMPLHDQMTVAKAADLLAGDIVVWLDKTDDPNGLLRLLRELETRNMAKKSEIERIIDILSQTRPEIVLTKNQEFDLGKLGDISKGVQLEMFWGVLAAAKQASPNQIFDVDYALFVCKGKTANPREALASSNKDVVYWPGPQDKENHHVFPFGSDQNTAAIIRSADERHGGSLIDPDETGTIYFSKLPKEVVRIVLYVHIYNGSTTSITVNGDRSQQLFKHADVRFKVIALASGQSVGINLGQKYPNNWGIVLCEFLKKQSGEWMILSVEQPLDGDTIADCIRDYQPRITPPGKFAI